VVPACVCSVSVDQSDGSEMLTFQVIAEFTKVCVVVAMLCAYCVAEVSLCSVIIDFPNLGITYNGGWCSATIAR